MSDAIRIRNIFYMLCYAFRVLRKRNYADIAAENFSHVQDLCAEILVRGIAQQRNRGLYRSYVNNTEERSALRGSMELLETKRLRVRRIPRVVCSFDEFSEDNEVNRILRATAQLLLRSDEVSVQRKQRLKRELMYFGEVSETDLAAVQWNKLQFQRNNLSYEMLMNICRMVWQSLLPSTQAGKVHFSLFDEDSMPRLYEKFILEYYRRHYPMLHANSSAIRWNLPPQTQAEKAQLLPGMHCDVMLKSGGKTLIIDAKYYQRALIRHLGKQTLHSANLYQLFTYVKNEDKYNTGNVSGLLLYARTAEELPPVLDVMVGGNRMSANFLDLNRDFREIASTLDNIVDDFLDASVKKIF